MTHKIKTANQIISKILTKSNVILSIGPNPGGSIIGYMIKNILRDNNKLIDMRTLFIDTGDYSSDTMIYIKEWQEENVWASLDILSDKSKNKTFLFDQYTQKHNCKFLINGRRSASGGKRSSLGEYDSSTDIKPYISVQPLHDWSIKEVMDYIKRYKLPYNNMYDNIMPILSEENGRVNLLCKHDGRDFSYECGIHKYKP
jgi:hypothetical protein